MDFLTTKENLERLGSYLRSRRLGENITQLTLAKRSGISLKAVRNIESGSNASMFSFVAVCRTLGCIDWVQALEPPSMTRADMEHYLRGSETKRKRARSRVQPRQSN